jgi:hypothetical protein
MRKAYALGLGRVMPLVFPLVSYLLAVGAILLTAIVIAGTALGPSPPAQLSTDFQGLPPKWRPPPEKTSPPRSDPPANTTASIPPATDALNASSAVLGARQAKQTQTAGKKRRLAKFAGPHRTSTKRSRHYRHYARWQYHRVW